MREINTKEALTYISSLKGYILFVSAMFTLSTLTGYWYSSMNLGLATQTFAEIGELLELIKELNPLIIMIVFIVEGTAGLLYVLVALVPHAIIELPMILFSAAIGVKLGHDLLNTLRGKKVDMKKEFKNGALFYIYWILPLLFVAAVVETFITPLIVAMVVG